VESLLRAHDEATGFLKYTPLNSLPTALTEKLGDRIGRYKLLEKIGEGGCSVVYAWPSRKNPCAGASRSRSLSWAWTPRQVIARFEGERQELAMMDHPNIAKVFAARSTERPLTCPAGTLSPSVRV